MRRLPTRAPRAVRRRIVGAMAGGVLCVGGLAALPAPASAAPVTEPAAAEAESAATPPMGFNNWNSTHCRADFNESMVKGIADIFVDKGLKAAGYQYVNLDDCWALPARDADGKLVPDPVRFPNGIKAVADYVHSKGLKLGIYTSAGTKTCNSAGFPGALGHEYSDAQQFADWGVDYLKYDNCNNQGVDAKQRYTTMRDALRATGRPIVYSICEWGQNKPWEWAGQLGQLWRTTGDISDSWGSMLSIMKQNLPLAPYAGPGNWNDPDMLEVGNGGMTDTEYRTHFSMWSIMASPLLIGTDLRKASDETYQILSNRDVIAVDQDPLGKQGTVVSSEGGRWVVAKQMADGSRAVALFNESGSAQRIATTAQAVGLPEADAYVSRDLWQHKNYNTAGGIAATVPAHGTVLLRVSVNPRWAEYPPAAELGAGQGLFAEAGRPVPFDSTFTNQGRTAARDVSVSLDGPDGTDWAVKAGGPAKVPALESGTSLKTPWTVTPPSGTSDGSYQLTLNATYRSPQGTRVTTQAPVTVQVVTAPPSGASSLGDLAWMSAVNGYGPVERNTSNGESAAGDGHPITIGGTVYAKGLGVHAQSEVTYYTGRACERVTAQVGVDDEKGTKGTVAFEVWADDQKVASTGTLTNADAARAVSADVSGAQVVRLVVTDGGDAVDSDHADWADAQLSC
ncbi:NPCBM/NEW2 domain-containing protein [Streptomyces sp. VRA16 Mangrove soil]|uniref:NPCBM/NEW2 domain-containing protein n=1 Tax=Streptomyces sp. VRA16 Mangrove soil TaxID=2817434 RepID=UPI001A9F5BE4|nr:NPCBM/NEW2 domain-containing protein [Streptomyces sp. VRA16 Mangrove soil]MBO1330233.1 NPCBM/NEW2 domain-containing protein [Streptomyces sp. VRA16 Mangrove soil]